MPAKPDQNERLGNEEAYEFYDEVWYRSLSVLNDILKNGTPTEQVSAARAVLDYSKHFTILGAPYVPESDMPDFEELD